MRSTGEVMGIDVAPGVAFVKSQLAAGTHLPEPNGSCVFLSLADRDKADGLEVAKTLAGLGFCFVATAGTARYLEDSGIHVRQIVDRLTDRTGITAVDLIQEGKIAMVINTPRGRGPRADGAYIRKAAGQSGIPLVTTVAAALAAARGMADLADSQLVVRPLQAIHATGRTG
jgi:carbamoyl-phosphate synthase large subunit